MSTVLRCSSLWRGNGLEPAGPCEIVIRGGVIETIRPADGPAPRCHVMPAFFDAHCHLLWMGMEEISLDLSGCRNAGDLLGILAGGIARGGSIVRGEKWDDSSWDGDAPPGIAQLDAISGLRPVLLRRVCGHSALVNTAMLSMLRSAVPGGVETAGGPGSAVIVEGPVLKAFDLFPPSRSEVAEGLGFAQRRLFANGVTGVCTTESLRHLGMIEEILDPDISIAINVFDPDTSLWPEASRAGRFSIRGAKLFLDGGLGACTAAVDGKFADGSSGFLALGDDMLAHAIEEAWSRGLEPVVHAIGARALGQLCRISVATAEKRTDGKSGTVRVEHAEQLEPVWPGAWRRDLHRFCMQPNFVRRWQGEGGMYAQRLGAGPAARLNPFSLPGSAGFDLGFGSDGMPFGPLWGLAGALSHPVPEFSLDRRAALEAYTLGAARISGFEDLARPMGAGRRADLVILDGDPMSEELDSLEILLTMAGGRVVFTDDNLPEGSISGL